MDFVALANQIIADQDDRHKIEPGRWAEFASPLFGSNQGLIAQADKREVTLHHVTHGIPILTIPKWWIRRTANSCEELTGQESHTELDTSALRRNDLYDGYDK
jgi:hypothetical protein